MTQGEKIKKSRKTAGVTREDLALHLGISPAAVSKIENDDLKFGPTPEILIKISDYLNDRSILVYSLLNNPICQRIIPRAFTPLNNINDNTSAILAKLKEELEEAIEAVDILSRNFSIKDPTANPAFKEVLLAKLEQIIDVPRCVEELVSHIKEGGFLLEEEHLEVHIRQQAKVEAHGHHVPEKVEASHA